MDADGSLLEETETGAGLLHLAHRDCRDAEVRALGPEPGADLLRVLDAAVLVGADFLQDVGREVAVERGVYRGRGVEARAHLPDCRDLVLVNKVLLADDDCVGERDLLHRLVLLLHLLPDVARIDDGYGAIIAEALRDELVVADDAEERARIRKAGGLDDHPAESRDLAAERLLEEIKEGVHER